jgi:stearoyl-CoA desaturase (Delta-9 desaturase)
MTILLQQPPPQHIAIPSIPTIKDLPPTGDARGELILSPADRRVRAVNLGAVTLPLVGLGVAVYLSFGTAFDWTQAAISLSMSFLTALGVTIGYHRLFTHKSFIAVAPVRWLLAVLGSMAVQGPVIERAGAHRRHHQHSDDTHDPHSPHQHARGCWGSTFMGTLRGFYHAHVGWLFEGHMKGLGRYTADLRADPLIAAVSRQFVFWVIAGLLIPALLGGLITMSWKGALLGFLWGGLVRVLVNHHITWSVNSVCHLWGTSPFRSNDESRNNAIVGVLAFGEGWHNNHHAFPTSARHGLRWWEFDASYIVIKGLALLGLASHIRVPPPERIEGKRR